MTSRRYTRWMIWWVVIALSATISTAQATPPLAVDEALALFETANQAYTEGDRERAADLYQVLIEQGIHDANVYFNLGQTQFELGDLARARLNFYRAQRLQPRDGALVVAQQRIAALLPLEEPALAAAPLVALAQLSLPWVTLPELIGLTSGLWVAWCVVVALIIGLRVRARWLRPVALGLFALLFVTGILSAVRLYETNVLPLAVMIAEAPVYSGPGEAFVEMYALAPATDVIVVDEQGGWRLVEQMTGRRGWVLAEAVTIVRHTPVALPQIGGGA